MLPTFKSDLEIASEAHCAGGLAHVQADVELIKAETIAEQMLEEAKAEAEQMIMAAHAECDEIRAKATEEGFEAGIEQARIDALAEIHAEWDQRIKDLTDDIRQVIAAIQSEKATLWKQTEKDIVTFSIEMAQKIIKTEVQQNPKVIGEVIRHCLRRVVNKERIRVRISPADIDAVRSQREDLMLVLDGAENFEIIDDRRVQQGGCVIETIAGTIDAKMDTQLERVVTALEVE